MKAIPFCGPTNESAGISKQIANGVQIASTGRAVGQQASWLLDAVCIDGEKNNMSSSKAGSEFDSRNQVLKQFLDVANQEIKFAVERTRRQEAEGWRVKFLARQNKLKQPVAVADGAKEVV